ncbi:MAG: response regulator [Nitrosomonadales bacterium]|jgi:DNA-binding response OmpR family regulator
MANILVVDDDEFLRCLTSDALAAAGYSVDTAEDGQVAWERLDAAPALYDLILLDRNMPRLDGLGLLQRIRSDERYTHLPVIMLTGVDAQQDFLVGLAAGAAYYLSKPVTEEILNLVVKTALEESCANGALQSMIGQAVDQLAREVFTCRTLSEARMLALKLAEASGDPLRTLRGYSELLVNAVEHGNLAISYAEKNQLLHQDRWSEEIEARLLRAPYADRQVQVELVKTDAACVVTITDQGDGFDWQAYLEFSAERIFDLNGRGIAISKATSFDRLEYLGCGNCAVASVTYSGDGHGS